MKLLYLFRLYGGLCALLGMVLLIPAGVAKLYQEPMRPFLLPALVLVMAGSLGYMGGKRMTELGHREGFAFVSIAWLLVTVVGAVPFLLGGAVPNFSDAFFEAASGFTTTGATILTDIEGQFRSILFWRSLLHWLGGMGIIVLFVAVLPRLAGGMQLFKAEVPGPIPERLMPRLRDTAMVLWGMYLAFSTAQAILLRLAGLDWLDAWIHTFGTMATGGFSTRAASVEGLANPLAEWIIIAFMLIAGANFALYFRFLRKRQLRGFFSDVEFKAYLGIIAVGTLLILSQIHSLYGLSDSLRISLFQAISITTTTGYTTTDYDLWPHLGRMVLLLLMFVGGMSGSTGGSMKVIRVLVMVKYSLRELGRLIHPRAVLQLRLGHQVLPEAVIRAVISFVLLYFLLFGLSTLVMTGMGMDPLSGASAVAATLGNVGPGLGMVGPMENYAFLPGIGKIFLSLLMIIGRLEIYSVFVLLAPSFWAGAGERRRGWWA